MNKFLSLVSAAMVFPVFLNAQWSEKTLWKEVQDNGFVVSSKTVIDGDLYLGGTAPSDQSRNTPWVMKVNQQGEVVWHSDETYPTTVYSGPGVIQFSGANDSTLLVISQKTPNYQYSGFILASLNKATGKLNHSKDFLYNRPAGLYASSDSTFVLVRDIFPSGFEDSLFFEEYDTRSFQLLRQYKTAIENNNYQDVSGAFDGERVYVGIMNQIVSLDLESFSQFESGPLLKNNKGQAISRFTLITAPDTSIYAYADETLMEIDRLSMDTSWTVKLQIGAYNNFIDYLFSDSLMYISTNYNSGAGYGKPSFNLARVNLPARRLDYFAQPFFDSIPIVPGSHYGSALDIEMDQNKQLYACGYYESNSYQIPGLMKINPETGEKVFERTLRVLNSKATTYEDKAHALYIPGEDPMVFFSVLDTVSQDPVGYKVPLSLNMVRMDGASREYKSWSRIPIGHHYGSYLRTSSASPSGTFVTRQKGQRAEAVFYDQNNIEQWTWSAELDANSFAIGGATVMGYHYMLVGYDKGTYIEPREMYLPNSIMYTFDAEGNVVRADSIFNGALFRNYYNRFEVFTEGNHIFFAEYEEDPDDWYIYIFSYNVLTRQIIRPSNGVKAFDGTFGRFHRNIIRSSHDQYYVMVQNSSSEHVFRPLTISPKSFSLETFSLSGYVRPYALRDADLWAKDTIIGVGGAGNGGQWTSLYVYQYYPSKRQVKQVYLQNNAPMNGNVFNTVWADTVNKKINVFGLNKDSMVVHVFTNQGALLEKVMEFPLTDGNPGYITESFFDKRNSVFYLSGYTERPTDKHRALFMFAVDTSISVKASYFGEYLPENNISTLGAFKLGEVLIGGNFKDSTERFGFINLGYTGASGLVQQNTLEKILPIVDVLNPCGASSDVKVNGRINLYAFSNAVPIEVKLTLGSQSVTQSLSPVLDANKYTATFEHEFLSVPGTNAYNVKIEYFVDNALVDSLLYPIEIGQGYCARLLGRLYDDALFNNCQFDMGYDNLVAIDSLPFILNGQQRWLPTDYQVYVPKDVTWSLVPQPFVKQISSHSFQIFDPSCEDSYSGTNDRYMDIAYIIRDSVSTVGIDERFDSSWQVYPNPNGGIFYVDLNPDDVGAFLTLSDITGRLVYSKKVQNNHEVLYLENLVPGVYNLELVREDGTSKRLKVSVINTR